MHECTSIIINSFHLFQQTLFNKGFQGFPYWGRGGGAWGASSPSNNFFEPSFIKIDALPWDTPYLKMKPSHLKSKPSPIET